MNHRALLLATRSHHKAGEIRRILERLDIDVVTLDQLDIDPSPDEDEIEVHDTFQENALAKARYFARRLQRPAMADDSGLRVDALDGAPGVRTKRFSGRADLDGQPLDDANNALLLETLRDVPASERGARYVCVAAIAWPDGRSLTATGTVAGSITTSLAGAEGFGYDPLFHVPALGARFSEVTAAAKSAISHRARAFRALATALEASPWPLSDR